MSLTNFYSRYRERLIKDPDNVSYNVLLDPYWFTHQIANLRVYDQKEVIEFFLILRFRCFMAECLREDSNLLNSLWLCAPEEADSAILKFSRKSPKGNVRIYLTLTCSWAEKPSMEISHQVISDLEDGAEIGFKLTNTIGSRSLAVNSEGMKEFIDQLKAVWLKKQHKDKLAAD